MKFFQAFFVALCYFITSNAVEVAKSINVTDSVDGNRVILNGTEYFFSSTELPWFDAMLYCDEQLGMRLGSLQTEEKYTVIKDYVTADPVLKYKSIWTGGTRAKHSSQWIWWPIKETFTFTYWSPHYYPSKEWYQQSCAIISGYFQDWTDGDCYIPLNFFCEQI